jgi:hypothetical protein
VPVLHGDGTVRYNFLILPVSGLIDREQSIPAAVIANTRVEVVAAAKRRSTALVHSGGFAVQAVGDKSATETDMARLPEREAFGEHGVVFGFVGEVARGAAVDGAFIFGEIDFVGVNGKHYVTSFQSGSFQLFCLFCHTIAGLKQILHLRRVVDRVCAVGIRWVGTPPLSPAIRMMTVESLNKRNLVVLVIEGVNTKPAFVAVGLILALVRVIAETANNLSTWTLDAGNLGKRHRLG